MPPLVERNHVFSIDDIKTICVNYRLKFLGRKYFKAGELPYEAITAIRTLEKHLGENVRLIDIMGVAKFSKLQESAEIPLLFAPIDKANYYLIYKSGIDIAWYIKIFAFPLRSIFSFLTSFVLVGLPLVFLIPFFIFHNAQDVRTYQMMYLAMFIVSTLFFLVFGGFTFYKNFSNSCWNSPSFNSK